MKRQNHTILVVDDSSDDLMFMERALRKNNVSDSIHLLQSGAEAIEYLNGEGRYSDRTKYEFPSFIITDLKMPEIDGFTLVQFVRNKPKWAVVPMIILSGSSDLDDIKKAYLIGSNSYLVKPANQSDLETLLKKLYNYWVEVEVPLMYPSGEMKKTESSGKLGQKIPEP